MNRQFAPQVETQRVPPVGLQPAMHLAVHALRAVLERPEDFLAAFFSSMPEPGRRANQPPDGIGQGRAPIQEQPPCNNSSQSQQSATQGLMQNGSNRMPMKVGYVTHADAYMSGSPLSLITLSESLASFVPAARLDDVRTANRAGEWGCAVTPPLCPMDGNFALPGLLQEQA